MRLCVLILVAGTAFANYTFSDLRRIKTFISGPFQENIHTTITLVIAILSDDRIFGKLNISEVERSESNAEQRKKSAAILKTALAKDFMRENLRDLQLDSKLRQERIAAVLGALPGTDFVEKYKNYTRHLADVEKRTLELFSPNGELQKYSYRNGSISAESLFEYIYSFMGKKNLVRRVLESNKYTDAIFLDFFHMFRNHGILLSIDFTAEHTLQNGITFSNKSAIEAMTKLLTLKYGGMLVVAKVLNNWRDEEGYAFDELFTKNQLRMFEESNLAVPQTDHLNHLIFDPDTESMKTEYLYVTIKNCDTNLDKEQEEDADPGIERLPRFTCDCWVFRTELGSAPNNSNTVALAREFKEKATLALKGARNYNEISAAKLVMASMSQIKNTGLFLVVTTRNPGSLMDNVYSSPGGFKVVLDLEVTQSAYTEENIVRIQVIGYFITSFDL